MTYVGLLGCHRHGSVTPEARHCSASCQCRMQARVLRRVSAQNASGYPIGIGTAVMSGRDAKRGFLPNGSRLAFNALSHAILPNI